MEHDGKFYCGLHDPIKVAARKEQARDRREARWNEAVAKERAALDKRNRAQACEAACEGAIDPRPGELAACRKEQAELLAALKRQNEAVETLWDRVSKLEAVAEAARRLMLSRDVAWDEGDHGHDWPEAVAKMLQVLDALQPKKEPG